jgi:pimeloyl-ACP methyl ester carboxylesterase
MGQFAMDQNENTSSSLLAGGIVSLVSIIGASTAAWIAYSAFGIDHDVALPSAIETKQERLTGTISGSLSYYVDRSGTGRPLVLIHSVNAAASAYEMKPIFEHYRGIRPVFALDSPGFGFSERSDRVYNPQLYAEAITDLLSQRVQQPSDVIALSLGCEFAARAAAQRPELFHSLTLISPSGFTERGNKVPSQRASESSASDAVYSLFSFPLWSQAFYDLLATRPSIHYFLQKSFEGSVDARLKDYAYATSHQTGARYAPLYFVSGKLFTPDVRKEIYERLLLPVLVLYDRDSFVRFDTLPDMLARHQNWRGVRIPATMGLPQFERLSETTSALDRFWQELP